MNEFVLKNRHTLLLFTIAAYILLVVVEGLIMDRDSRIYEFENPFFDLNLENYEEFESRRQENRQEIR